MSGLDDIRKQHPEYNDMSDVQLADSLHKKFYSDLPKEDFYKKVGVLPKEAADDPSRIAGMYGKAALQGVASIPDIPAQIIEAPGALFNPDKPGASFVENLESGVKSNHLAPNLGEKVGRFVDEKFDEKFGPGYLEPTTPQGKVGVSATQGAAMAGPFGMAAGPADAALAALGGASGGGTGEYALQHGASPDQAAALGALAGGATFKSPKAPQIAAKTIEHIGKFNNELADKITKEQTRPSSQLYRQIKDAGIKLTGEPKADAEAIMGWFDKAKSDVSGKISKKALDPDAAQAGISKNYFENKKLAEQEYAKATEIGEGKSIVAKDLQNKMERLIGELKQKSFLEDTQKKALDKLEFLRKRTGDGRPSPVILDEFGTPMKREIPQTIGYNDLVDLKQVVNDLYDKKNPSHEIGALSEEVDRALSQAGKQTPEFGAQLEKANKIYGKFKQDFENNKVLGQVWQKDDALAMKKHIDNKMPLPDETRKRAQAILSKVKTPVDIDAVVRHMPEDQANDLRAAKVNEILGKSLIENTGIEENRPLLNHLIKNDPKAIAALDKIDSMAKTLAKRGIKSDISVDEKSNLRKFYAIVLNAVKGPKGMALDAVKKAVSPPANNEQLLKNLSKEVKKGAPGSRALEVLQGKTPAEEALQ